MSDSKKSSVVDESALPLKTDDSEIDVLAKFRNYDPELTWTEEEERAVIRKWDLLVFPMCCLMFFFLQLDRGAIANAVTTSFLPDLGINIDDNNLGTIIFMIGFITFEIPSNVIIRRVGSNRWIPLLMVLWGSVSLGTTWINNKGSYFAVRLLLGITEAGWIPGTLLYLGDFYTRAELGTRLGIFWGTITFATAFSGSISYAIFTKLDGVAGLRSWRWLFLIEGIGTILIGLFMFLYLPNGPQHTKGYLRGRKGWVTERQERIAVARVFRDDPSKGAGHSDPVTWFDIKDAVTDYRLWLHLLTGFFGLMPNSPLGGYLPLVISSLNFNVIFANLLTTPLYLFSALFMSLLTWHSSRVSERALHSAAGNLLLIIGLILVGFVPAESVDRWVRWAFLFPTVAGFSPWHGLQAAWIAANMGTTGKRTVALAMYIMSVNLASIPGSQIFRSDDAPAFRKRGFPIVIGLSFISFFFFVFQYFHYRYVNAARDKIWNAKTEEEKDEYLKTTKDVGNRRLDFRFLH
ncbi:putative transporter [Cladochytrium replicatum]|nr:putative transporter [Cladochytrium replicatum]